MPAPIVYPLGKSGTSAQMPGGMAISAGAGTFEGEVDHLALEQRRGDRFLRLQPFRSRPGNPVAVAVNYLERVREHCGGASEIRPGNQKIEGLVRIGLSRCQRAPPAPLPHRQNPGAVLADRAAAPRAGPE